MPYFNPTDDVPTKIGQVIGDVISALIYLSVAALMVLPLVVIVILAIS